jgi:hypothetical protein
MFNVILDLWNTALQICMGKRMLWQGCLYLDSKRHRFESNSPPPKLKSEISFPLDLQSLSRLRLTFPFPHSCDLSRPAISLSLEALSTAIPSLSTFTICRRHHHRTSSVEEEEEEKKVIFFKMFVIPFSLFDSNLCQSM